MRGQAVGGVHTVAGGYRFNFVRDIARVRLVMIDARNGRVLEPAKRQIVDDDEWNWVIDACHVDVDHLLIGTSLPVFVPGGLHDLQVWSEAICDGAWGGPGVGSASGPGARPTWRTGRRSTAPSPRSSSSSQDLGDASRSDAPATISVLSGDIHFSYASEIRFPDGREPGSRSTSW